MFAFSLGWIATAFTFQAKMPPALGWVAVVGLSMFLALYVALAGILARALVTAPIGRVLVLAAAWMLGEWLRGWVLSGFAWNPLGAIWLEAPGVAQLAEFFGTLGLSGLVVLAGGGLWLIVKPGAELVDRGVGVLLGLLVVLGGVIGDGRNIETYFGDNPTLIVVQPNIGQDVKYEPGAEADHLQTYLGLTATALANLGSTGAIDAAATDTSGDGTLDAGAATPPAGAAPAGQSVSAGALVRPRALVLWSESSVFGLVEEDAALRARLAAVLGPTDLLLFGGVAAIRDAKGEITELTNSLFVLDARARILGRYDKAHLVPLGEYVPARALMTAIGLARLAPGDLDFRPGPGPRTLALPGAPPVGVQICYEIIFPGAVIDAANRPAWIANISNDAWFGPSGPPQHLAQARLRAIEEGLPIARATPTGMSAVIDARGNVLAQEPAAAMGVITATLPPPLPETLFARYGHGSSLVLGLLLLGGGLAVGRRRV
jgi:apolipoprotein N-acyltransferase